MFAISVWVNRENVAREVDVAIGTKSIHIGVESFEKESNKICIFTKLRALKEIECEKNKLC